MPSIRNYTRCIMLILALIYIDILAYSIDTTKLQQCNVQSSIYIPFYLNNQSEAEKAAGYDADSSIESVIHASELIKRDCFDCYEIQRLITNERQTIINSHNSCQHDNDCVMNWANTVLRGGCQYAVNTSGDPLLTEWVKKWENLMENTNQLEFHHEKCGYATPMCMPQRAKCVENKCISTSGPEYYTDIVHSIQLDNNNQE